MRYKDANNLFYICIDTHMIKRIYEKQQKTKDATKHFFFCQIHYFVVLKVTRRRDLPLASIDITITLRFLRMNISIYRIKNKPDRYELYTNYQSI